MFNKQTKLDLIKATSDNLSLIDEVRDLKQALSASKMHQIILEDRLKQVEAKKIVNSIKDLEQLIALAKKQRIDLLEVEGHKIVISRHDYPIDTTIKHPDAGKTQEEIDEETLFYSSSN